MRGVCIASLVLVIVFISSGQNTDPLAGRDISVVLRLSSTVSPANEEAPKDVRLGMEAIEINGQPSFRSVLKKHGVLPDGDSLGLIYDLNPTVYDLSNVREQSKIIIPVAIGSNAKEALEKGFLLEVKTDTALKDQLASSGQEIHDLVSRISTVDDSYFGNSAATADVKSQSSKLADSVSDFVSAIKEKRTSFPREVLLQLHLELDLFKNILLTSLSRPDTLDKSSIERLSAINEDFEIKSRGLGEVRGIDAPPARWPSVRVVVRTVGPGNKEVSEYRIHCVPKALVDIPDSEIRFANLSSPAEATLPEANYRMWASFRTDSKKSSEELDIRVRDDGSKQIYDLVVSD